MLADLMIFGVIAFFVLVRSRALSIQINFERATSEDQRTVTSMADLPNERFK